MAIDLNTAKDRLAQARADVDFYANLVKLLGDPRLSGVVDSPTVLVSPAQAVVMPSPPFVLETGFVPPPTKRSPRGEVRRKVNEVLPEIDGEAISTARILELLTAKGYIFVSKHPLMAINDALGELQGEGKAKLAKRVGVTNYWTKGEA